MSPPSNNVTLAVSNSSNPSRASFPTQNERERSRNAKAQARHRAKRKAYVEQVTPFSVRSPLHPPLTPSISPQLEQTVTRLQAAISLANDEMGPLNRIRELEEENARLRQDIIELRRELEDRSAQFLRPDIGRRTSDISPNDSYRSDSNGNTAAWGDFEYKKSGRLSNGSDADRDYLLVCSLPSPSTYPSSPADLPPLQARPPTLSRTSMPPPPPLHIPSLQYSGTQQQQQQSRALYPQQNGSLTYPVTSPTSSSSSPTYSVSIHINHPPSLNDPLTHLCGDFISPIICHRLSLDLRAVNSTITPSLPLMSITLRSRSRTTAIWLVLLAHSQRVWGVHHYAHSTLRQSHSNTHTHRTSRFQ